MEQDDAPRARTDAATEAGQQRDAPRGGMPATFAVLAFFLILTGAWLPWWVIRWSDAGGSYDELAFRLFADEHELVQTWMPQATGAIVAAAIVILFVRVGGRSWRYEPASWRRDLWLAAGLAVAALASALAWPAASDSFWGGRTYEVPAGTFTEESLPGLGWWLTLVAAACLLWAAILARRKASRPTA